MPQPLPDRSRRSLLGGTAAAAATGLAAAVLGPASHAKGAAPEAPARPPGDARTARGYHETAHTRRYYELARF
ncbi:MAG TPA: formate dehydrogenase [Ramlibacter sp.]|nr:formate dehydrogenase [Ramlibacter sp.]